MLICVSYIAEKRIYVVFNTDTARHTYTTKAVPGTVGIMCNGAIDSTMYDMSVEDDMHVYSIKEGVLFECINTHPFRMFIVTRYGVGAGFEVYDTWTGTMKYLDYFEMYRLLKSTAVVKGVYLNVSDGISYEASFYNKDMRMHAWVLSELILGRSFGRRRWL